MKQQSKLELIVGMFMIVGIAAVVYLALRIGAGTLVGGDTYELQARFSNTGGLNPGSNVVISGVPVGRVEAITLNTTDFSSVVRLRLRKDLKLPTDSIASIKTSGLIGDKFLALSPGADDEVLAPGALITNTESTVDLESLISRFAFGDVKDKPAAAATPSAETPPATPATSTAPVTQ